MRIRIVLFAFLAVALLAAGCVPVDGPRGSFERTLQVEGPVQLDVRTGSGRIEVRNGPPGEVHVRGEFRVSGWSMGDADELAEELMADPPIRQNGSLVRVGDTRRMSGVSISYTIVTPEQTDLVALTGSGRIQASGLAGAARLTTGSGRIEASGIGRDAEARTGSGRIYLSDIAGWVRATTGSGRVEIDRAGGDVRAQTGSGSIVVRGPGGRVRVETGSGRIEVEDASADLNLTTGSGSLRVQGNPAAGAFWLVETGSGSVTLEVPPDAGFRLYARARDVDIESPARAVIEEQSRREMRARFGTGEARVEARASSGRVRIR